jgi:hypothetical protein
MRFPTEFTDPAPLPYGMSAAADAVLDTLHDRDMEAYYGFNPEFAALYRELGKQTGVKEMCPNDEDRFAESNSGKWVAKGDTILDELGRGTVTILDKKAAGPQLALAANGWTGPEVPTPPNSPEGYPQIPPKLIEEFKLVMGGLGLRTTYAVRVSGSYGRQGLAHMMNTLLVDGGNALWGAEDLWLETWKSNPAGPKVYAPGGWEKRPIEIPTFRPSVIHGRMVEDTRTWYTYPNALLPSNR